MGIFCPKTTQMNFFKLKTLIFTSVVLVFSSCSKDNDDQLDSKAPEIAFNEPSSNLYGIADTVPLKLHIHDDVEIHTLSIQITNQANTDTISMFWNHIHKSHLMIDTSFVAELDTTVMEMANYYIRVVAEDTAGNSAEETESVHIMEGTMENHNSQSNTDSGMGDGMGGHVDGHM